MSDRKPELFTAVSNQFEQYLNAAKMHAQRDILLLPPVLRRNPCDPPSLVPFPSHFARPFRKGGITSFCVIWSSVWHFRISSADPFSEIITSAASGKEL